LPDTYTGVFALTVELPSLIDNKLVLKYTSVLRSIDTVLTVVLSKLVFTNVFASAFITTVLTVDSSGISGLTERKIFPSAAIDTLATKVSIKLVLKVTFACVSIDTLSMKV
jgi:hypothetical protein